MVTMRTLLKQGSFWNCSYFFFVLSCGQDPNSRVVKNPLSAESNLKSVGGTILTSTEIAQLGLVALVVDPQRADRRGLCSGTLVRADLVLTAAHCFSNPLGAPTFVQFGIDAFAPKVSSVKIKSWTRSGTADLALVKLESLAPRAWSVTKVLRRFSNSVLQSGFGAGFGRTSTAGANTAGVARKLSAQFQNVGAGVSVAVAISGSGKGFCFGDSGGPLYVILNNETVQIGVLSNGAQSCETGVDNFVLTPFYEKWLNQQLESM
jgi:secreted trypsin-like serine protease